ncbi:MAG: hypothetical protein ABI813_04295 [Bacteroidota bacterium]
MKLVSLLVISCCLGCASFAQKAPKVFRPFYFNFGLNMGSGHYGSAPLASYNAKQNILDGYYGVKMGYLFELGTKIYFNSSEHKLRYGLDWTFLSASYNEMNWDAYAAAKGGTVTGARIFNVSTKLGPVLSYNIVKKLVAHLHFQVAPVVHYSTFEYNKGGATTEDFNFNADNLKDLYGGIKTNLGVGVSWGVIGLGLDYFSGKLKTGYLYDNTLTGENSSNTLYQKISTSSLQLKLTLNL